MGSRILVVGDVMLDQYWDGAVERISPEAPVPVLRVTAQRHAAGGAANVAVNLASLGAEVTLLAPLGRDEAALQLAALVARQGVDFQSVSDDGYCTTRKVRFVSRRQQPGFGHHLYPEGDPRATALLQRFDPPPVIARFIEKATRLTGLQPNVDVALAALVTHYKLPDDAAFGMFATARSIGLLAHTLEQLSVGQVIRPRGRYVGIAPERQ